MQTEDYLAMGGVKARNALTDENDVEVLKGVYLRDPRTIVAAKAERRLHVLGVPLPKAEAAEPEAETPAPVAEPEPEPEPAVAEPEAVNVDAALPLPLTTRRIGSTRLDYLTLTGITTWTCRGCGVEAPLETFGTRAVGAHRYMQPRCVKCRNGRKLRVEAASAAAGAPAVGASPA